MTPWSLTDMSSLLQRIQRAMEVNDHVRAIDAFHQEEERLMGNIEVGSVSELFTMYPPYYGSGGTSDTSGIRVSECLWRVHAWHWHEVCASLSNPPCLVCWGVLLYSGRRQLGKRRTSHLGH